MGLLCLSWTWQLREIDEVGQVSQAGILGMENKRERKLGAVVLVVVATDKKEKRGGER